MALRMPLITPRLKERPSTTRCGDTVPLKRVRGTRPMASGSLNFELVSPSISRWAAGETSPMNCMNRMGWLRLFM